VEAAPEGDKNVFIDFMHEVDGSGGCSLYMPAGGSRQPATHETVDKKMHYVHQDGQAVFKYAVRKMSEVAENLLKRNGMTGGDVDLFVPHQANRRIIMSAAERLGMPEEKVIINIDEFGNTTAATIPLALQSAREQGRLKKGDLVLMASVGAGFTVGATLMRWGAD
jgi:3-oxoacyl-[acyl-carrier-protein] synthase III